MKTDHKKKLFNSKLRVLNIFYNRIYAKKDKLHYESYFDKIVRKEPSYLK